MTFVGGEVDSRHEPVDFVQREDGGQMFVFLGPLQQFGRVLVDIILVEQKPIPRVNTRQGACLRSRGSDGLELLEDKLLELVERGVYDIYSVLLAVVAQALQILLVAFYRIGRIASLQPQPRVVLAVDIFGYFFRHGMSSPWKCGR